MLISERCTREFDLKLTGGQMVQPLPKGECSLEITLNDTR